MKTMLEVSGLSVSYARKGLAAEDVSLVVPEGSIVALLGANGAGKTTLIRAITGLLELHGGAVVAGRVDFAGEPVLGLPAHRLVRLGMAQVPEGRLVFKQLTVEENLNVGAAILPRAAVRERMEAVYQLFPRLLERRKQAAGWLSGGEQQMLALGRALVAKPRVLLVDELSLGLALEFAATAYILERGRIVLSGPAAEVAASEIVTESYLGTKREAVPPGGTPAAVKEGISA